MCTCTCKYDGWLGVLFQELGKHLEWNLMEPQSAYYWKNPLDNNNAQGNMI